ncbi:hypothetical protein [Streptomyces collinus]|uniref:hypothetical protein n=1 Tax=Streptomyces collinus TaxID=42684 RepID=UPI0037B85C9A
MTTLTHAKAYASNGAPTQRSDGGGIALRLDAQRVHERVNQDIQHFALLDPDIAWVADNLQARFDELSPEDTARVTALMWPSFKTDMMPDICPPHRPFPWGVFAALSPLPPFFCIGGGHGSVPNAFVTLRHGLVEGAALREMFEKEISSGSLTAENLLKTATEVREWEHSSDSSQTRDFDQARSEVDRLAGPERKLGAVAAGVALGAGAVALGVYLGSRPK